MTVNDSDFFLNDFEKPQWNCEQHHQTIKRQGGRKNIADSWHIAIEITNTCSWKCANCSRAIRHVQKPFNATLEFIEKALISLNGWNRGVTIMGGEPQEHPQFNEICSLLKKYNHKYAIFTSFPPTDIIRETFHRCYYTNHNKINLHHSLLVAPDEIIENDYIRNYLIKTCWYNKQCADAIITPWGAFFCEIASVIARIIGKQGYTIEPGWWMRPSYSDQECFCLKCGLCVPMPTTTDKDDYEFVTPKMYKYLAKNGSLNLNKLKVVTEKLSVKEIYRRIEKNNSNGADLSLRTDREVDSVLYGSYF